MALPVELQADENLILRKRRHILFLTWQMGKVLLTGVLPIVVLLIAVDQITGLDGNNGTITGAVAAVWGGFWLIVAYFTWYRYNRDEWVVTDQRLIDSIKRHWFHHQISSADLIQIEDMSVNRSGLLQTMFNFGDLRCQTAGTKQNFVLAGIPDPAGVLGVVDAARDSARRELAHGVASGATT